MQHDNLHADASLPGALVISGLEYASARVQNTLWTAMDEGRIMLGNNAGPVSDQQGQWKAGMWMLPEEFLVVYVCPIGDGRERPFIHKSLVSCQYNNIGPSHVDQFMREA